MADNPAPDPREFKSVQLLEMLFESVRDGIAIFDPDGRIQSCNGALALIVQARLEDLIGGRPSELWGGRNPEQNVAVNMTSDEQTIQRPDGSSRIVSVRTVLLQGDPPLQAAIYRDITHYKKMERRGRESEDQYRFLLEHVNDGVLITQHDRVVYANDALAQMLQCSPEEFLFEPRSAFGNRLPQNNGDPATRGALQRYEATCIRSDGAELPVEVSVSEGPYSGATATFEVVRDITERRRSEKRSQVLLTLGQKLNLATSPLAAARIIMDAAQELLGWDACSVELGAAGNEQEMVPVLYVDTIHGEKVEVQAPSAPSRPSTFSGQVLISGPFLLLRTPEDTVQGLAPFGDKSRRSMSLMFVPIQGGPSVVGVMSLQSYTPNAYTQADLEGFQALADHCSGALQRTLAISAVQESEQRYRQMFENTRAMKLLVDPETGDILDANPAACDFYGRSAESLRGLSLANLSSGHSAEEILGRLAAVLKDPTGALRLSHVASNGKVRQVEIFASPLVIAGKTLLHSIVYDITDREVAFAQVAGLADLGRRLSSATNSTDAGRIVVDVADKLIGWDSCFVDLFASEVDQQVMTPGHLLVPVIHMDVLKGVRREVRPNYTVLPASTISYNVLQQGPLLILRSEGEFDAPQGRPFGDENRPSASLMFVPITGSSGVLGVLSIQSYRFNAYTKQQLDLLQSLANHCAGALERTRAEEQVRLLESAVRFSSDMVIITSADPTSSTGTRIVFVNDAVLRMTGYTREELLGQPITILQGPETNQDDLASMHKVLAEGKPVKVELVNYRKDRTPYVIEFSAYSICDMYGRPRYFVSVQRDVTERKRTEMELTYRAFHDPLTDLPNRSLLLERLQHAIARSSRSTDTFAVLFLDLDGFKEVNDNLGHDAGDQLLVIAARRLETCVRPGDTVARLGGDEFVVLLEGIENLDMAIKVGDRILESFQTPFVINGQTAICTASVGIAERPATHADAAEILKLADLALYQAKTKGKSRYEIFEPPPGA